MGYVGVRKKEVVLACLKIAYWRRHSLEAAVSEENYVRLQPQYLVT
jgi:hypothetical protein